MSATISPKTIQKLSFRNKIAFAISILSFLFLFPGIYLSMITLSTQGTVHAEVPNIKSNIIGLTSVQGKQQKQIKLDLFDTTRSILKTVHDLWQKSYFFVASMIILFSVIIPVMKGILLTYIFFNKKAEVRKKIFVFIKSIGKWSMCDVFIVAILLAYLSTGATHSETTKNVMMMGYSINMDVMASMHAQLQAGFWCFLSYCLLSLSALQLYDPY